MPEQVHDIALPDRNLKLCRCCRCGIVERCTLHFDFFGRDGEPMECESCTTCAAGSFSKDFLRRRSGARVRALRGLIDDFVKQHMKGASDVSV